MMTNCERKVGYQPFLPAITAATRGKKVDADQLSNDEFLAIVENTYRDSVIKVMKDTLGYQISVPIDVYESVSSYDIIPPRGFMIEDVIDIQPNKIEPKDYHYTKDNITLECCPDGDIKQAFFVKIAVTPMKTMMGCEFDEQFVNEYYDVILELMLSKLLSMPERSWKSLEQSRLHDVKYMTHVMNERRKVLMREMMSATSSSMGYLGLLPYITSSIYSQTADKEQLNVVEFKSIVSSAYNIAVKHVMKDTTAYQVTLPIDVYEGVSDYDIVAPSGFDIEDVIGIEPNKIDVSELYYTDSQVTLSCCPNGTAHKAFGVRVALSTNDSRKINHSFSQKYKEVIQTRTMVELLGLKERGWHDAATSAEHLRRYDKQVSDIRQQLITTTAMSEREQGVVTYRSFLPTMTSRFYSDKPDQERLSQTAFRQMVAVAYNTSVKKFMEESELYRDNIVIDVYEGVTDYPLDAPKGYAIKSVIGVTDYNFELPDMRYDINGVELKECPKCDAKSAFAVEVALVPTSTNRYSTEFVSRYEDIIAERMSQELYSMSQRPWANLDLMEYHRRNYDNALADLLLSSVVNDANKSKVGAPKFWSKILPFIFGKAKHKMTMADIKQIVDSVYRTAVIKAMRDTKLYKQHLAIDLYEGVKQYDIIPPDGYVIEDVGEFKEHNSVVPRYIHDRDTFTLTCCPNQDVTQAFYIEVSLTPIQDIDTNDLDNDFVDRYYDLILTAMKADLYSMREQHWYDPGQSARHDRDYNKGVATAKRRAISGGSKVLLTTKRLSDG